jgi:predicted PurR-regulated permease PerM
MTSSKRNSYLLLGIVLVLAGWGGLGTLLTTTLFCYFVLNKLTILRYKWLTISAYVAIVSIISALMIYFLDQAARALPKVISTAVPMIIQFSTDHNLELPFTDMEGLKTFTMDYAKDEIRSLGGFAETAAKQFVFLVIGIVGSVSIFLSPGMDLNRKNYRVKNNIYTASSSEIANRFRSLYESFNTVMGAQLTISTINTGLTSIFVLLSHLPYGPLIIVITFFCGLIPIAGNLLSNLIIVGVAFTVSPHLALWALAFLVLIHKLEYFLNSKIIGERINNPVWLTLIGLIVGERLMGLTGMILAPVLLNYIKLEAAQMKASELDQDAP